MGIKPSILMSLNRKQNIREFNYVDPKYYNNYIGVKKNDRKMKIYEARFTKQGFLEFQNDVKGGGFTQSMMPGSEHGDQIKNINLAMNFETKPNGLFYTHLSQNKEANNFIDNQGQQLNDVDIALDF